MHRAAWPDAAVYEAAAGSVSADVLDWAGKAKGRPAWLEVAGQGLNEDPDPLRHAGRADRRRGARSLARSA